MVLSSFLSRGVVLIICFDQSLFFCMDNHHYCTSQVSRTHEWCPMLPESFSDWTCRARDLPRRARILADGGYAARVPVITPRRIARNRRQSQTNRALRSLRMQIKHSIGFQKVYASINSIFRHKRFFLPFVVCTCGFLSNRRKLIIRRPRRL